MSFPRVRLVGRSLLVSADRRATWDSRFAARPDTPGEPEPWVVSRLDRIPAGGRVLDLACGDGRNALHAARRGYRVVGVDFARVGLDRVARFADRAGVTIPTHLVDLEADSLDGPGMFDGAIVCHYKPAAPTWEALARVVVPNGVVLAVTFNELEPATSGFPARFCLAPGEWRSIPGFRVAEEARLDDLGRHVDGYVLLRV